MQAQAREQLGGVQRLVRGVDADLEIALSVFGGADEHELDPGVVEDVGRVDGDEPAPTEARADLGGQVRSLTRAQPGAGGAGASGLRTATM